jgi:hypothetical protein
MVTKTPLNSNRIRKVPGQFSWVDHRLVRNRHIDRCSHAAATMYLFLVTVGDGQGISYYADRSICQRLRMDQHTLAAARDNLVTAGLIAWRKPLYQVLSLQPDTARRSGSVTPMSLGQIMKRALGGEP